MEESTATYVQLLGGTRIRLDETWQSFVPDKRYQLLAYLAYYGDWVSRERLAFLFWPDTDSSNAKQNLRGLLQRVRTLGWLSGLEANMHQLRWSVQTDVGAFRQAVEKSNLDEAVSLYAGPLLHGLESDESPEFSAWLEFERGRFHGSWRDILLERVKELEGSGQDQQAAKLLRRLLQEDELDEEALRAYMLTAARAGQRQEALKSYHDFARRLDEELGMEPTSSTQQLRESIKDLEPSTKVTTEIAPPISAPASSGEASPSPARFSPPSFIPAPGTSFVGRDLELAEVSFLLSKPDCRLLTLTGPGGIGKTRLALQVAREFESSYQDGAHLVLLESFTSAASIVPSIMSVLEIEQSEQDPFNQLLRHLKDKQLLLVLDNYEHLLEGATIISHILQACPGVKVLATSRERLNLEEEHLLPLEGLAIPEETTSLDEALASDAVQLFLQRARRVLPRFEISEADLPHVLQICQLVQGLPLGLELSAVWVRAMPLEDIAREMGLNLDLLSSDSRNVSNRHRSIRAAFEYSWRLLSPKEQDVLAKLAVFRGGFTREAAAYVADAPVAVLAALVDKSLLRMLPTGRYDRHPLLYQYTQEKLAEHPKVPETRERHAAYYLETMRKFFPIWERHLRAVSDIRDDFENTVGAWEWSTVHKVESLKWLSRELFGLGLIVGQLHRAGAILSDTLKALEKAGTWHDSVRGCLMIERAYVHFYLGEPSQALQLAQAGLSLLPEKKDFRELHKAWLAFLLLVMVASAQAEWLKASTYAVEALVLARRIKFDIGPPEMLVSITLAVSVETELALGRYVTAEARAAAHRKTLVGHAQLSPHPPAPRSNTATVL